MLLLESDQINIFFSVAFVTCKCCKVILHLYRGCCTWIDAVESCTDTRHNTGTSLCWFLYFLLWNDWLYDFLWNRTTFTPLVLWLNILTLITSTPKNYQFKKHGFLVNIRDIHIVIEIVCLCVPCDCGKSRLFKAVCNASLACFFLVSHSSNPW